MSERETDRDERSESAHHSHSTENRMQEIARQIVELEQELLELSGGRLDGVELGELDFGVADASLLRSPMRRARLESEHRLVTEAVYDSATDRENSETDGAGPT